MYRSHGDRSGLKYTYCSHGDRYRLKYMYCSRACNTGRTCIVLMVASQDVLC